jgi:hypothetical protein
LEAVLGVRAALRPWRGAKGLPFFMADGFEFAELELFGHKVVLAADRKPGTLSPSEVAARMRQLRSRAPLAIYVTEHLVFHDRRALVAKRTAFIVPGAQLYLPDLGIDLREHVRAKALNEVTALTPSAQAFLIANLLARPWSADLHPAAMARALDYTVMTASRAANELLASGLAQANHKAQRGTPRQLTLNGASAKDVWRAGESVVKSPVTRTVWIDKLPKRLKVRIAGTSALARHSMLAATENAVYAVNREDWLAARKADPALTDLGRDPGRIELQIWSYSPGLAGGDEVDPLSLIASVRDDDDERVQLALNELRENLKW